MMYKLPSKFTGCDAKEMGVERFKTLLYSLQGLGVIEVKSIRGYSYPRNYYEAAVVDSDGDFNLYMNCFRPVMTRGDSADRAQRFVNKPALVQAVESLDPEIVVLTQSELSQKIGSANCSNLKANKLKELNYRLPCTVGRASFSWFFD